MGEDGAVDDHKVGKLMFHNTGSTFPQNKIISCHKIKVKVQSWMLSIPISWDS